MRARDALGIGIKLISVGLILDGLDRLPAAPSLYFLLKSSPRNELGLHPIAILLQPISLFMGAAVTWWVAGILVRGKGSELLNKRLTKRGMAMGLMFLFGSGLAMTRLWAPLALLAGDSSSDPRSFYPMPDLHVTLFELLLSVFVALAAATGWRGGLDDGS